MELGFEKAYSNNLPNVDSAMVFDYYKNHADFTSAEVRNVKATRAARESYGDNAVGKVQLKRDKNICYIKAAVTPEHKVRSRSYNTEVIIDEVKETIISCKCFDCSASEGGCKHSIAVLLWLHRRSEEPSVTSTVCYWKKSALSNVGTSQNFCTLQDICGTVPTIPVPTNDEFLKEVLSVWKKSNSKGLLFQLFSETRMSTISIHSSSLKFIVQCQELTANEYIEYLRATITDDDCLAAEKITKDQSKSSAWYEVRYGRITASNLFETSRCKTDSGSLVEKILGASKPIETPAVKRGSELESMVLKEFENAYNLKVEKHGIFIKSKYPIFGASPDGLTFTHCIEIKCPFKQDTIKNYISEDGIIAPKPFAQVQLQMLLTDRKFAYFIVASPTFEETKEFSVSEVELDIEFCRVIMEEAQDFWKKAIYPVLLK